MYLAYARTQHLREIHEDRFEVNKNNTIRIKARNILIEAVLIITDIDMEIV